MYMEEGEPHGTREYYKQKYDGALETIIDADKIIRALMRSIEVETKHKGQSWTVYKLAERFVMRKDYNANTS